MGNLFAVAAWHADKAIQAYHANDMDAYTRHIAICDRLRRQAYPRFQKDSERYQRNKELTR